MLERGTLTRVLAILAAASWGPALGQDAPPQPPPANMIYLRSGTPVVMPLGATVSLVGGEASVPGKVVTGKPYSADSITESTQILADGNRIVNRNEAHIDRDSQGRTRVEQRVKALGVWQADAQPPTMITINDPVAHVSYALNSQDHTARQLPPFVLSDRQAAVSLQLRAPADGTTPRKTVSRLLEGEAGAASGGSPAPAGASAPSFEVTVPAPAAAGVARLSTAPVGLGLEPGSVVEDDLGEQVLQGVLAHGVRETRTIPAGAIGNEREIDIVSEQWYSPDLEAVVQRRNVDPRFGEITYRLVNVQRSEPPPELFTVPQDYQLVRDRVPHVVLDRRAAGADAAPSARADRRVFLVPRGAEDKAKE